MSKDKTPGMSFPSLAMEHLAKPVLAELELSHGCCRVLLGLLAAQKQTLITSVKAARKWHIISNTWIAP